MSEASTVAPNIQKLHISIHFVYDDVLAEVCWFLPSSYLLFKAIYFSYPFESFPTCTTLTPSNYPYYSNCFQIQCSVCSALLVALLSVISTILVPDWTSLPASKLPSKLSASKLQLIQLSLETVLLSEGCWYLKKSLKFHSLSIADYWRLFKVIAFIAP